MKISNFLLSVESHKVGKYLKALVDIKCMLASVATKMTEFGLGRNHMMLAYKR